MKIFDFTVLGRLPGISAFCNHVNKILKCTADRLLILVFLVALATLPNCLAPWRLGY